MPPSSRWIAVGAAVSIALVVYGLFALYDMAREDALTRVAALTTEQAVATAPPPDPTREPESGDTKGSEETDDGVGKPPERESTIPTAPEPAEDDLALEEGPATTPGDSPTDNEVPSSAASDEQAESTAEAETTASDEDPVESSAGPPASEDSAGQPHQADTQAPAEQAGEAASPPEEAAVSSAADNEAAAPSGVVEPEPADPGTGTAVGSGGEADPPELPVARQEEAPSSPTPVVVESAEETPPATESAATEDTATVDEVVAPAPEPAEPPAPVVGEDAEPSLAEAEATPDEPTEETPPATARSETWDVPEVTEIAAPAPEPADPPAPVVRENAEPVWAEAEATPDEPAEETPPVTAGSEIGGIPEVDPLVAPAPELAAAPEPIEPQDEEPVLAEAETIAAEHAEDSASAPSTDGSERAAEQKEPATTPVSEAQTADVAAAEQPLSPESPDTAPAVRADGPGPDDGAPPEAPAAQQVAALPEAPAEATAPDRAGVAMPEEPPPGPESTAPPPPEDVAQFDVVQVSPDGTVVVAGRTAPGSQVELVVDGEVIATADTNRNGEFVFVPDEQLLPGVRELSIAVQSPDVPDRRLASRIVVVLIPDREMLAARVTEPTESTPSEAPIALLVDEQGETVGVIQPSPSMAEPDTVLSLTTVTFDEDGFASITGGGEAGQKVTVYLDNEATGSTIIGENGYWTVRTQHPLAKTGSYKVRIDQTAPNDDTVTERIVTTLIRAGGKLIPAAATVVTVVKGNTLWGISRRHYGRGILYTLIYDSNSYQIADPHWIYPGQKFLVPERN